MSGFRPFKAKAVLIAIVLLLAGHFLVLQRSNDSADEFLHVRGDSAEYFRMAEGDGSVSSPFRYRSLVPFLVSLLPLDVYTGFLAVSYAALFFSFLVLYRILERLELGWWTILSGLLLLFFSETMFYLFHNPFLTDAAGLLFLFLVFLAAHEGRLVLFGTAAAAGLLCREATLFVVPTYLGTRQFRAFAVVFLILLGIFLVPRMLFQIPGAGQGYFAAYFDSARELGRLARPLDFLKGAFFTWDFVWLSALLGLLIVPRERRLLFVLALVSLGCGAFLAGIVATDLGRMFSLLAPPLVCLSAVCLGRVRERSLALWSAAMVFIACRALFSVPTVVNSSAVTLSGSVAGRRLTLGISLLIFLLCALALRKDLRAALGTLGSPAARVWPTGG